jgi:hypothetical protein
MFERNLCYRWIFSSPLFNQETGVSRKIKRYTQVLQLTQHFKTTTNFAEHKTALQEIWYKNYATRDNFTIYCP